MLKKWIATSFSCNPGILREILNLLKLRAMAYEEIQKLYVISFDDMSVDSRRCFDNSAEEMLGPYKSVLVAMIRGLCSPWKQPIYYSFDTQMTDQLLKTIVTSVEQTGLIVVAVVSDMGSKNAKVWKDLNVNYESPCFLNPIRITNEYGCLPMFRIY